MVKFKNMTDEEFENYYNYAVSNYAEEKIEAGNWSEENAEERARNIFKKLLPDGLKTKNNYLYSIYTKNNHIGYIWFKINDENRKAAFLNDIIIFQEYRGKGYGEKTMKLFERKAKEFDCERIQLHVFAHNDPAVSLYKKLKFKVTNIRMEKDITDN
mgnify:FL=1